MSTVTVVGCGFAGKLVLATSSIACWALAIDWALTCSLLATRRLTVDMLITARANSVSSTSMIALTTRAAPRCARMPVSGFMMGPRLGDHQEQSVVGARHNADSIRWLL